MKTCPNCATSLPDFVNVCTKCKFNLASPPPPKPPVSPAPSAQISSPPPRVASVSVSGQGSQDRVSSSSEASSSVDLPPKKNKFAIYAGGGVVALVILGWFGQSKTGSDESKPIKEQAALESANTKSTSSAAKQVAPDINQIMRDAANKPTNNSTPNRPKDANNSEGTNANKPWYQQ